MKKAHTTLLLLGSFLFAINLFPLFILPAFAVTEVTLAWDANQEDDLDGYAVYIKESTTTSFSHVADIPIDELTDPASPMATISELEDDLQYFFAVTAYDVDGNESDFSNQVIVQPSGTSVPVSVSHGGGGGGGGGG